ncbi:MAG: LacI family transcriptional regulator [Gemmatimonadales bacterium]|nr:LacI family transcriptional regulator [Gemmatimonadales bacterium]
MGHYRRSNYARRRFRPAADGWYPGKGGQRSEVAKPVLVDATRWPGVPLAPWPPVEPARPFMPPAGRGRKPLPEDVAVASWLPVKRGLVPHGLRHGQKTWMAEDGIPEILQADRLGHEVPGMRGVYTHVSDGMRKQLMEALQRRWEAALDKRLAIDPHSPVPILEGLLREHERKASQGIADRRRHMRGA